MSIEISRNRFLLSICLPVVFCLLVVTGCASTRIDDPLADHSFLTNQPCAAPCWYGIKLGDTSKDSVRTTLKKLPFVDSASIQETQQIWLNDPNAIEIDYNCLHPLDKECGGIQFASGEIKLIWTTVGYDLTFKQVVDVLGPPEYVDYGPDHPETYGCLIDLTWPKKSIGVHIHDLNSDAHCKMIADGNGVAPDIKVETISYSSFEVFRSKSGGCCIHATWPGFAK
jgi:hypothetical protein